MVPAVQACIERGRGKPRPLRFSQVLLGNLVIMATPDTIAGWFAGRLPDGWFTGAPSVAIEGEQIVVVGTLDAPKVPEGASDELKAGAEAGRISRFREATRPYRIAIAREAEHKFEQHVTWGATAGGTTEKFNPGGSGRSRGSEDEPKKVEIHGRPWMRRAWRRRFAFGGPGAFRRGTWAAYSGDVQSF
jgi:hypothetical protein